MADDAIGTGVERGGELHGCEAGLQERQGGELGQREVDILDADGCSGGNGAVPGVDGREVGELRGPAVVDCCSGDVGCGGEFNDRGVAWVVDEENCNAVCGHEAGEISVEESACVGVAF